VNRKAGGRPPGEAKPWHHGDLPAALQAAALELVAEKGVTGFSLRQAALRAGVSIAAPYHHYAGREALLAAIARQGFQMLRDELYEAATDGSPQRRAACVAAAYLDFAKRHPSRYKIMYSGEVNAARFPELQDLSASVFTNLRAASEGVIGPPGRNASADDLILPAALWALLHGLVHLQDGHLPAHVAADEVVHVAIASILAGGGGRW
jgi:AcrR family transcriptional regulator